MFKKKRKISQYKLNYRKSPSYSKKLPKKRYVEQSIKRNNPLTKKRKKMATLAIFVFGIILLIYMIFFSNFFLVERIKIVDENFENESINEKITTEISDTVGQNLFFMDTGELQLRIIKAFPEIEGVVVDKDYPQTLTIEFSKYPLVANIVSESQNIKKSYIINAIGYVIKEDLENQNLPYIKIRSEEPINVKTPVIESSKLAYILESITYFEDKFGMRVIESEYKTTARELHLLTEKNFYIWMDIQRPYEEQLKKLKKALVKLDIYNENLQYIDLRIAGESGDKIIYKRL